MEIPDKWGGEEGLPFVNLDLSYEQNLADSTRLVGQTEQLVQSRLGNPNQLMATDSMKYPA